MCNLFISKKTRFETHANNNCLLADILVLRGREVVTDQQHQAFHPWPAQRLQAGTYLEPEDNM
jgi:hypothetical protein